MSEEELQVNVRVYNINTLEFGCGFVLMRHKRQLGTTRAIFLNEYGVEIVTAIDVRYPDHDLIISYKEEEFKNFIDEETYLKYSKK